MSDPSYGKKRGSGKELIPSARQRRSW